MERPGLLTVPGRRVAGRGELSVCESPQGLLSALAPVPAPSLRAHPWERGEAADAVAR